MRQGGADDARRSRVEHGFPERIEDLAAAARSCRDPARHSRTTATTEREQLR